MTSESCKRVHDCGVSGVGGVNTGGRMSRIRVLVSIGFVLVLLGLPGAAGASEPRTTDLMSIGATGGTGLPGATFRGASADGTRVFFQTSESLVSGDTDASTDVYERAAGVTTLISTGPNGGNGAFNAIFNAVSEDGSKVFFRTAEKMVAADTDSAQDLYMRAGGTTTWISTGPSGANGSFSVVFDAISADGSRIFFDTSESLVSADSDAEFDIYQRSGSTTTLISTGPAGGNGEHSPDFDGISKDGTRVFFSTDEILVSSDTDISFDVYQRFGTTTTHLSIGPDGGNGNIDFDYDAFFSGASADGTKVWLDTDEILTADDTDASDDVYQASGGSISRISFGPSGGNAEVPTFFGGASDDGNRVFFDTSESLVAADTDSAIDVYERSGGTTTLLTLGSSGGNGPFSAGYQDASADGSRVFFQTLESLAAADTDSQQDIYQASGGQLTPLSTGPAGGNGGFPVSFNGSSRDGGRVTFTTVESLDAADTDGQPDIYQRRAGDTTWISTGPTGGNGGQFVTYTGMSEDGIRVFFHTTESLVAVDTDTSQDVYGTSPALAYVRPRGATPFRVPLVPAFQPCGSPNSTHGAPLAFSSCRPPVQASGFLTVGAPDANGAPANSSGSVRFIAVTGNVSTPADEADMRIDMTMTDVRRKADLTDYTGQLQLLPTFRITDRLNGSAPVDPGTGTDVNYPITVPCATTAATTVGSTCTLSTTADAVTPGLIVESKRMVVETAQVRVFDGGADGVASTAGNTLFAIQGVFTP
jgi:hypothetical protein